MGIIGFRFYSRGVYLIEYMKTNGSVKFLICKNAFQQMFAGFSYLLSLPELDKQINTTLVSESGFD